MKLIATKSMTYATRRLQAGDSFEAKTPRDGRILIAIQKAKADDGDGSASVPATDIASLRGEYKALVGKEPFNGWDADTLRDKIEKVRAR